MTIVVPVAKVCCQPPVSLGKCAFVHPDNTSGQANTPHSILRYSSNNSGHPSSCNTMAKCHWQHLEPYYYTKWYSMPLGRKDLVTGHMPVASMDTIDSLFASESSLPSYSIGFDRSPSTHSIIKGSSNNSGLRDSSTIAVEGSYCFATGIVAAAPSTKTSLLLHCI
jgi:hypothetical protein